MSEEDINDVKNKFRESLGCLYLATEESVATDVRINVFAYTNRLEEENKQLKEELSCMTKTADCWMAQARAYREALAFYADEKKYDDDVHAHAGYCISSTVQRDYGAKAREALGE